ncbi:hypothetical protein ACFV20_12350 [Streptomyces sp. NPDC059696]|uniref:hypothetical protein n=1 Tax=Streptomyces sp. NPDC059696 TaxID=3346911 RepID=UPI00369CF51F
MGAPYEDVAKDGGQLVDAGAVYIIHGTPSGIGTGSRVEGYTQSELDSGTSTEAYDWFGYALRAGGTANSVPYLVVGVGCLHLDVPVDHAAGARRAACVIDSRGASGGIDVNKRIPGNIHANEAEIAVPRTIDSCHIRGCWHETTGEWIPNPNYRE